MLVFDCSPEPFDKHVVTPSALAVHADFDLVVFQITGEGLAGELAALVGVHDLRATILVDSLFQCIQTEAGVHADRDAVSEDAP